MKIKLLFLSFLSLSSFQANAGFVYTDPIITPGVEKNRTETENRAYAGLVWTLQDQTSFMPNVTFGIRSLKVKSNDNVRGADFSIRIKLTNGIAFDSTRLSYAGGERDLLGNLGFGYSNTNASFLGTAAVQGPYSRFGTDFLLSNKIFAPYLEVLTVDKPNKVHKISTSGTQECPPGFYPNANFPNTNGCWNYSM